MTVSASALALGSDDMSTPVTALEGDELAYSNTSFIKNAAPLMGRNLTAGVRVTF